MKPARLTHYTMIADFGNKGTQISVFQDELKFTEMIELFLAQFPVWVSKQCKDELAIHLKSTGNVSATMFAIEGFGKLHLVTHSTDVMLGGIESDK